MTSPRAKTVYDNLDTTRLFNTRIEYMDSIAALVVLYPQGVRKMHSSGRSVKESLASSCYPERLDYMFNQARFVRMLSKEQQEFVHLAFVVKGLFTKKSRIHSLVSECTHPFLK